MKNNKIDKETKIYKPKKWSFRKNKARENHPSLVIGENGNNYANLGLTHSPKRGHHKNTELSKNPNTKDKKTSYIRDDLKYDKKENLKVILKDYKLSSKDVDKILKIINKKR